MENDNNSSSSSNNLDSIFLKVNKKLQAYDKVLNVSFGQLRTNFDRFKLVWTLPVMQMAGLFDPLFDQGIYYDAKSTAKSVEYRLEGNEAFRLKRLAEALAKYNLSIRYAEPRLHTPVKEKEERETDNELALAYANRSAVFFHMNEFALALSDIDRALRHGYPARLRPRLIERKLNCLFNTEQYEKLMKCVGAETNDINLINYFALKVSQQKIEEEREKDLSNVEDHAWSDTHKPVRYFTRYADINFDINLTERNVKIATPTLNAIGIEFALPRRGFHIKAQRAVGAGELLLTERPYAAVLLGRHFESKCFECMLQLEAARMNVTYCRQCATVSFCSPECEKTAWRAHHQFECKYVKLLAFDSGLTHMEWLALRIVLRAGNEHLLTLKPALESYESRFEHMNRVEPTIDHNTVEMTVSTNTFFQEVYGAEYRSDSYLSIFNLVTNSAVRKLSDLFRRSFVALFLVRFLYRVGFIGQDLDESYNRHANGLFLGGLLLRHLQSISCNAHEVSRLSIANVNKQPMAHSFADGIGAGIYALLSMFNHSCDPHVTRTFRGSHCQVRALRVINKGEEVLDNYGVLYAVNDLAERQQKLAEQYFFECKCTACENNWPLYDKLVNGLSSSNVICEGCRGSSSSSSSGGGGGLKSRNADCSACIAELDNLKLAQLNAQVGLSGLLKFNAQIDLNEKRIENVIRDIFAHYCAYLQLLSSSGIKRPFQDYNNFEEALKQLLNLINLKQSSALN